MILGVFRRRRTRQRLIETLQARTAAAARAPGLYAALGIPDTVEGRFEVVCLHVILVLRRLRRLPPPADDVAQDLVNAVFAQFDASLRELGVGDLGVSKRMKRLAGAFYGRAAGYDAALDLRDETALSEVLARNVHGTGDRSRAIGLARYVLAAEDMLAAATLESLLTTGPPFPTADNVAGSGRRSA